MQKKRPALPPIEVPSALQAPDAWRESLTSKSPDDVDVQRALNAQRRVAEAVEGLLSLRSSRDPRVSPGQHLDTIDRHARRLAEQAVSRVDEARQGLVRRMKQAQDLMHESLAREDAHSAEVRKALRELPPEERDRAVRQAIEAGNRRVIGAVMAAPGIASGLPDETLAGLRTVAAKRLHPELVDETERLSHVHDWLLDVAGGAQSVANAARPTTEQRAEYEQAVTASDAALAKLAGLDQ